MHRPGDIRLDCFPFAAPLRVPQHAADLRQRPAATVVAGYQACPALGRHVSMGEKGIQILAPVVRRVGDETPTGEPTAPAWIPARAWGPGRRPPGGGERRDPPPG
jgi:hypothetical protein